MVTAVDANILLDCGFGDSSASGIARRALHRAEEQGPVIISTVCFAEVAGKFLKRLELTRFLDNLAISVSPLNEETAFLAGQFFREYKLRGGTRERILPDFLIAAHAQLYADRILTRDHRFFTGNFPKLTAVAPEDL
jgi:predicted nucleic acid-binding protein